MSTGKTLMVTPYAPYRDGIATYAVQEVRARRRAGELVEVLSPLPSAAHHHAPLGGVAGMTHFTGMVSGFDRLIIQFSPELIFGRTRTGAERLAIWSLLSSVVERKPTDLRIHEIQYGPMRDHRSERRIARRVLRKAERVTVHTEAERLLLAEAADMDPAEIELIDHGLHFVAQSRRDRSGARAHLGLPPHDVVFLSIGFIQEHKGFDRTVTAFGRAGLSGASAHVVGDVRVDDSSVSNHAETLSHLVEATPGAHLHRGFVGDAAFDDWIIASDCVVLPYREIWSSSVVERARLLGRPVIATRVGGLQDQYRDGLTVVDGDDQLIERMRDFAVQHGARRVETMTTNDQTSDAGRETSGRTIEELQARVDAAGTVASTEPTDDAPRGTATQQLDRVQPLAKPAATSHRRGIGQAKSIVNALTHFQIHPLVEHINRLHRAIRASTKELEDRLDALEARLDRDS